MCGVAGRRDTRWRLSCVLSFSLRATCAGSFRIYWVKMHSLYIYLEYMRRCARLIEYVIEHSLQRLAPVGSVFPPDNRHMIHISVDLVIDYCDCEWLCLNIWTPFRRSVVQFKFIYFLLCFRFPFGRFFCFTVHPLTSFNAHACVACTVQSRKWRSLCAVCAFKQMIEQLLNIVIRRNNADLRDSHDHFSAFCVESTQRLTFVLATLSIWE